METQVAAMTVPQLRTALHALGVGKSGISGKRSPELKNMLRAMVGLTLVAPPTPTQAAPTGTRASAAASAAATAAASAAATAAATTAAVTSTAVAVAAS